jgi:hypothetical protein
MGFIDVDQLKKQGEKNSNNSYGKYILELVDMISKKGK